MTNSVNSIDVKTVVVIGASGFIGQYLLDALGELKDVEIRVLVREYKAKLQNNITAIEGDLLKSSTLDKLLIKGCTVINLAYLTRSNVEAMCNLAMACEKNQIKRLIHCSTAVVAGRTAQNNITEDIQCYPFSEYEKTKLQMEKVLLEKSFGKFEVSILRPTAVFGSNGINLLKLTNELMMRNSLSNYIRSCLFNRRTMNLVCVENVVAALIFLSNHEDIDREIYLISDDDMTNNNYRDIEDQILNYLGQSYVIPRIFIPECFLTVLLWGAGKSNINPSRRYSDKKLTALGFSKPQNLETAIEKFIVWYKKTSIT